MKEKLCKKIEALTDAIHQENENRKVTKSENEIEVSFIEQDDLYNKKIKV